MCIESAQPVQLDFSISISVFLGGLVGMRRLSFDSPTPPQSVTPFPSQVRFDGDAEGQIYCSSPSSPARMKLSVTGGGVGGGGGKKGSQRKAGPFIRA